MYMTPVNPSEKRSAPVAPQQPLRPASKGSMLRINVLRSLQLHKVTAAVTAVVVLGLGLAFLLRGGATYEASSTLYVSPTFPATLHVDQEHVYPYDSYVQEQVQAIVNYDVIAEALKHLPPGVWRFPGETEQSAVERLQRSLEVKRIGTTYEVGITLTRSHPEHIADVINAVTAAFLDKSKDEQFYGRDQRLATLRETRDQIQKDLDDRLQEQAEITKSLGGATVGGAATSLDSELSTMRANYTAAHDEKIKAEAQLSALDAGDSSAPTSALNQTAEEIIQSDPQLSAMKQDLASKRAALVDQLASETPLNPQRKQAEAQLAQIDQSLQQMTANLRQKAAARLQQKLRSEVSRASTVEAQLLSDMQKASSVATSAAPRLERAEELKADIDRLQARYNEVDLRISELELEGSSPGPIHVRSPAMPPLGPNPDKKRAKLPLLFPAAILLGILAAILVDLLDPHIYNASDLEAILGFAPIGMLLNDGDVTRRAFDECILRLAAGIDHSVRIAGARTFVFTGVNAGAGTTSIVENLGSALARLGRKTLTIDASGNTAPVAYVTIGTNGQAAAGGTEASPPAATDLKLQPASTVMTDLIPANAGPLSGYVTKAFQELTREYDIVLIDAAPLMISAETEYLARCADVTVMVSEAGKTTRRKLTRAARLMEKLDVAGAAAVINKVRIVRVEDNLKHDLKEFETRVNEMNLRWRPRRQPMQTPPVAGTHVETAAEEMASHEEVSFTTDGD